MTDFTYRTDGFCYSLFPQNDEAKETWEIIAAVFEGGVIPYFAWRSTARQLKDAGYIVRKARHTKTKFTKADEKLLEELLS